MERIRWHVVIGCLYKLMCYVRLYTIIFQPISYQQLYRLPGLTIIVDTLNTKQSKAKQRQRYALK